MKVIGVGLGRTGTFSLKMALDKLGFGPTHHMEEVFLDLVRNVPLWSAAAEGKPDWPRLYQGFSSATDWPTAGFVEELVGAYPEARFILTLRAPDSWVDSYLDTIDAFNSGTKAFPPELDAWLVMLRSVLARTGFPPRMSMDALIAAHAAHDSRVRDLVPASQLLEFDVRDGWGPLCRFLGVAVPDAPFPRTNDRVAFWDEKQRPDGLPR